jgi:signal recognition particle subunit SRP19
MILIELLILIIIFQLLSLTLVTRDDNRIALWPEYFDSSVTKSQGRRVPAKLAMSGVTVEDIAKAAKRLKLNPKIERKKAFPSKWWRKSGRVLVKAADKKTKIIRKVALVMKKYRKQPKKSSK